MDAYYGKTVVALALIAGVGNCELSMCSFGILKNLTQRSLGSQGVRESGSQGVRESGSQGVRESGSQGVRVNRRCRGVCKCVYKLENGINVFINRKTVKPRCLQTGNQIKTTLISAAGEGVWFVFINGIAGKLSGLGVQPCAVLKRRNPVYKHAGWLQGTGHRAQGTGHRAQGV
jgi:hypothetical protein